jgi:LysR family positive regulator for ilvC
VLLARSEAVLAHLADLQQELREDSTRLRGVFSLYCSVTASYSILADLLPEYRRRFPEVEIKVHTGDEAIAIRRVQQSSEDVAIAARPDKLPPGLRFRELVVTPLVFIAPASLPVMVEISGGAGRIAQRKALAATPLILPEVGLVRSRVDGWLSELRVSPQICAQVAGNEAIAGMVALGLGCAFVPALVLRESPFRDRIRALDVKPGLPPFRIGLCCLARALENPLVLSLWEHAGDRHKLG